MGKNRKMSFNGRILARNEQKIYVHEKIFGPGGCLPLPRGYIHVNDQNIQTSSETTGLIKAKLYVEHP